MLSAAVRVPNAVGLNLTLIVQLAPTANELPHVWVLAKSLTLGPVIAIRVILKIAVPVLVSVTIFAVLLVPIG
jgi:hypothetical protein